MEFSDASLELSRSSGVHIIERKKESVTVNIGSLPGLFFGSQRKKQNEKESCTCRWKRIECYFLIFYKNHEDENERADWNVSFKWPQVKVVKWIVPRIPTRPNNSVGPTKFYFGLFSFNFCGFNFVERWFNCNTSLFIMVTKQLLIPLFFRGTIFQSTSSNAVIKSRTNGRKSGSVPIFCFYIWLVTNASLILIYN